MNYNISTFKIGDIFKTKSGLEIIVTGVTPERNQISIIEKQVMENSKNKYSITYDVFSKFVQSWIKLSESSNEESCLFDILNEQ